MDTKAARERSIELLEMVGIPDAPKRIDERPHKFSNGMLQRVMIAMAVSCNPRIIIADEPTTVVDVTIWAQLLELMKDLVTRLNTALIIVTQNLGVVARYAKRIYVMYAGRIVESGPSEVIFNNPRHPYTLGLLRSVPRLGETRSSRKLAPIHGSPPDLIKIPPYCAFLPRCTHKTERCEKDPWPALRQVGAGHYITCYADLRETP
jgi:peptide/nickel transport system ATP-binding protein